MLGADSQRVPAFNRGTRTSHYLLGILLCCLSSKLHIVGVAMVAWVAFVHDNELLAQSHRNLRLHKKEHCSQIQDPRKNPQY